MAQWLHYANRNHVRAVELDAAGEALWYATTGGLVRLDLERNLYQEFGRSEGLPSAELTGLVTLPGGKLLVGTTDMGVCLRTSSGRWMRAGVFDGLPDERVYCLVNARAEDVESPSEVWVGTEHGARKMSVGEDFLEPERGGNVILEDYAIYDVADTEEGSVFFATSSGLWRVDASESFSRYGMDEGLGALAVRDVERGPDDGIYLNTNGVLQRLAGGRVENVQVPFGSGELQDIRLLGTPEGSVLAAAASERVYFLDAGGQWSLGSELAEPPYVIGPVIGGLPVAGTDGEGLYRPSGATTGGQDEVYQRLKIPGPVNNLLTAVAVDSRGTVWAGGAPNDAVPYEKIGVSRFDGKTWTHFNEANSPEMIFNMVSAIDVAPDGRVYLGTYYGHQVGTGGVNILDDGGTAGPEDDVWEKYLAVDHELSSGVIRGDIAFDANGGAWIGSFSNQYLPGGLEYFDPVEQRFISYSNQLAERNVHTVAVDGLGNVWFGYAGRGLAVIPGGYGSGQPVRQVTSLNTALGGEAGINDLAVDRVNRLWIATGSKVVLLSFQEDALHEEKYVYQEVKPPSYAGLSANSIAFEGLTAAWFGTSSGIFRLDLAADIWTVFNRGNSQLASDEVGELFIDEARGVLWAATSAGLSAMSLAGNPAEATLSAKLVVRPNPWRPVSEGLLMVSGIPRYSRVTILTVSGEPVRQFDPKETINRLLVWDGNNQHGSPCASGVYLIRAESPDGGSASGKVALIR
ncbi:hypothetical protein ACFL5K_02395 [Gemmatimonadota bacterium]